MNRMIRAAIVDDSPLACRVLTNYLAQEPGIEVVGHALNGVDALELVRSLRPDVMTLDLEMPGMHGLDVLQTLMRNDPLPVVVVSGVSRRAASVALKAAESGAIDFVLKYTPGTDTDPTLLQKEIVNKVRLAARVKVIRTLEASAKPLRPVRPLNWRSPTGTPPVVTIAASTGGPSALRELLGVIPADFPAGIAIVQHLPEAFTAVLAAQLNRQLDLSVREAREGDFLEPGLVLIAPGGKHMTLSSDGRVMLDPGPEIHGHRPSADLLFGSVARLFGSRATAIVLTGMGEDGARGLTEIRQAGGSTYAQDEASSVVFGMPMQAIATGDVQVVGDPTTLGRRLCEQFSVVPLSAGPTTEMAGANP